MCVCVCVCVRACVCVFVWSQTELSAPDQLVLNTKRIIFLTELQLNYIEWILSKAISLFVFYYKNK